MTDQNTDALRCAEKLQGKHPCGSWSEHADDLDSAAAHIRRLVAENEALRATLAASCDEERASLWEAQPGGGCSRAIDAEHRAEAHRAAMRQALEALRLGRDALHAQAEAYHQSMRGYRQAQHDAMDAEVARADAAISTLKARLGDE